MNVLVLVSHKHSEVAQCFAVQTLALSVDVVDQVLVSNQIPRKKIFAFCSIKITITKLSSLFETVRLDVVSLQLNDLLLGRGKLGRMRGLLGLDLAVEEVAKEPALLFAVC